MPLDAMPSVGPVAMRDDRDAPDQGSHGWLVVETQVQKERLAIINLERQAFRTFLPRYWKTRRHARKAETVLTPLFPGYLFVKPGEGAGSVRALNGTMGVKRFVGSHSGRPAIMPGDAMAALLARCRDQVVETIVVPKPGSRVRFLKGPLADRLATVETIDAKGRLQLLVERMNRTVQVEADRASVGPV